MWGDGADTQDMLVASRYVGGWHRSEHQVEVCGNNIAGKGGVEADSKPREDGWVLLQLAGNGGGGNSTDLWGPWREQTAPACGQNAKRKSIYHQANNAITCQFCIWRSSVLDLIAYS
jgi:hypothetical protein